MDENTLPDFTDNFKKIFQLADNTRKLRKAFSFSDRDERAVHDKAIIQSYTSKKKNYNNETDFSVTESTSMLSDKDTKYN